MQHLNHAVAVTSAYGSLVPGKVFLVLDHSQSTIEDSAGAAASRVRFLEAQWVSPWNLLASLGVVTVMAKSSLGQDSDSTAAVAVLKRAVELDAESRYQQALVCYQEGIDMLLQVLKGERVSISAETERNLRKRNFLTTRKHSNSGGIFCYSAGQRRW